MTPETKPIMSFRQRRRATAGDQSAHTDPVTAERPNAEEAAEEPVIDLTDTLSDAAERLRRGYTSPVAPASSRRLAVVSVWALLLVLGGAVATLRALLSRLDGSGTGLAGALLGVTTMGGLVGLGLTIGAFLTIGSRRMPWILLGAATAVLFTLMVLTAVA
jgi:hypothetical protein